MPAVACQPKTRFSICKIKEWPAAERPRERLRTLGPRSLSTLELLALLIETGRPAEDGRPARSAMDLARALLDWAMQGEGKDKQPLRRILSAPFSVLCTAVPGIGPAKAAKIVAALDLGRRAAEEVRRDALRIASPRDVYEFLYLAMRDLPHEEFRVLLLNAQAELVSMVTVARGTVDGCEVHAREVFGHALKEHAHSLVLVHNHPSGEPSPSSDDRLLTKRLEEASKVLGVPILDHVILGEGRYTSFAESGMLSAGW